MASEWQEISLGDLFTVKHGFAFKGEFFTDTPQRTVLVTPGNFSIGGGFQNQKPKYYNGKVPNDYILKPGSVVITMTDLSKESDTLGISALIPFDNNIWLHNQRIGLVRFNPDYKTDPIFLNYLLRTHEYRSWIIGSASGTTVKHTAPSRIHAYQCVVPPIEEQKAIALILGSLDDKIELNRQMNVTLEAMAQALFKSWFVDFDPVIDNALAAGNPIPDELEAKAAARQALGDARKPLPEDIRSLFPNAFVFTEEMGWIPEGWTVSTAGEELNTVGGATPSTNIPEYWDDGDIHWTTPKDLSNNQTKILLNTDRKITKKGLKKISSGILPVNSVLMSSRAPVGYLALAKIPVAINQGYIGIKCEKTLTSEYVIQWLDSIMDEVKQRAGGTTFAEISKKSFREISVLVPSRENIFDYTKTVDKFYEKTSYNTKQTQIITQLRDALLPKLLSGELRIPEAERLVEESVA